MERRNTSDFVTNNLLSSDLCNRPKVVLINPNFQQSQQPAKKTIHVNPLFKQKSARNNYAIFNSNPVSTYPSSHANVGTETKDNLNYTSKRVPNLYSTHEQNSMSSKICDATRDLQCNGVRKKSNDARGIVNHLSSHYSNSNVTSLASSSYSSVHFNPYQNLDKNFCHPRKTYVNPKFLKIHGTPEVVKSEGSHGCVTQKKCDNVEILSETSEHSSSSIKTVQDYCSERRIDVNNSSKKTTSSNRTVNESKLKATQTPSRTLSSDLVKEQITSDDRFADIQSSSFSSSFLERSAQKKKLNLLKLQKITKLAQLAKITASSKKNLRLNTPPSLNFSNSSTRSPNLSAKPNSKSRRRSRSLEGPKLFKSCSKYKFVRFGNSSNDMATKYLVNGFQSLVSKNFKAARCNFTKSRDNRTLSHKNPCVLINPKICNTDTKQSREGTNQSVEIISRNPVIVDRNLANGSKIMKNPCDNNFDPCARKLFYISKKKLIRKSLEKRTVYQKKLRSLVKNKSIIKNINFKPSKNLSANFKINFKPSRTSADVINKRLMQRKVINRFKVMNVQQNQMETRPSPVPSTSRNGNPVLQRKVRRSFSLSKSLNSSFVSIGKTKLIRKSLLHQKLLKKTANNLKRRNHSRFIKSSAPLSQRKSGSQKSQVKLIRGGRNLKIVNSDLIAFGKTKLIKRSLLRNRELKVELQSKRNNAAAASVINKQSRNSRKTLFDLGSNLKPSAKKQFWKLKTKSLDAVKKKLLKRKRIALRCKNNIPCETFHRFGRCKKLSYGKCIKLHDKKFVAVCQSFVRGECKSENCLLSHEISPQKMPTCHHFLQGACSRDNCLYPHVKLSAKAPICRDFVRGFCPAGLDCNKLHVLICPEAEKNGTCSNRSSCRFVHRKKKPPGKKDFKLEVKSQAGSATSSQQDCKAVDSSSDATETANNCAKRYYVGDSGEELESFVPSRPKLGALPSFIPLSKCDPSQKPLS